MKRILEVKKKIGTLSKNSKNPFYKSQYLDLHSLLEAVEPLLQEQGLILLQPIIDNKVCTIIIDSVNGKELVNSSIELSPETNPQKLGIAITYFRRYKLTSLLAISEKDNDGNQLADKPTKQRLNNEGFDFLISNKSTKEDIQKALDNRIMETEQRGVLTDLLKTK
jgi:hypothetical protein